MIRYVNEELDSMFNSPALHPQVQMLALLTSAYCMHHFGKNVYVTSVFRGGDRGVHGAWRGCDTDNDKLTVEQKKEVAEYLNMLFIYDLSRPRFKVCVYHKVEGRGGDHWHLQVHSNTQLR